MWHSDNISRLPDFDTPEPDIVTARMHARVYANVWLPYDSASRSWAQPVWQQVGQQTEEVLALSNIVCLYFYMLSNSDDAVFI